MRSWTSASGPSSRAATSSKRGSDAKRCSGRATTSGDGSRRRCLEDLGLTLARRGRFDEAIEVFERALEVGWEVVPDGRCEIARVLLLAGCDAEADALWAQLRAADPDGPWTLNAGGMAYQEVGRDAEALEWLTAGLRRLRSYARSWPKPTSAKPPREAPHGQTSASRQPRGRPSRPSAVPPFAGRAGADRQRRRSAAPVAQCGSWGARRASPEPNATSRRIPG